MPRLFKRSQRYNVAKNCFLARIILLDNTNIEFNLLPEVTGADCLEKVAQVLDIQEVSPAIESPSLISSVFKLGLIIDYRVELFYCIIYSQSCTLWSHGWAAAIL